MLILFNSKAIAIRHAKNRHGALYKVKIKTMEKGNGMNKGICFLAGGIIITLLVVGTIEAGEWRHPIGLTYVSGFSDIVDVMEENKEAEGYIVDSFEWPVGLSYHPYYQMDNGLGFGIGLGPVQMVTGDLELFNFSVSADVRYKLFSKSNISLYGRAGIAYNIISGDYVDSSSPGFIGGVGIEFNQQSAVGWGIEVSYNTSEIKMEKYRRSGWSHRLDGTEEINPEMQISIFIIF